jgi:hypothetical protein
MLIQRKAVQIHILAAVHQVVTRKADTLHIITKGIRHPAQAVLEHTFTDIEDQMADLELLLLLTTIKRDL